MSCVRLWLACAVVLSACSKKDEPRPAPPRQAEPEPVRFEPLVTPSSDNAFAAHLTPSPGGFLMTWLVPAGDGHRVQFSRFDDGEWGGASTIAEGSDVFGNWADFPSAIESPDGAIVAHWPRRSSAGKYSYDVALARSTDLGRTWTDIGLANDDGTKSEHGFVSMIPAGDRVRAFWLDGREMSGHEGGAMTLRTALIGDSVTEPAVVDDRVCECCGTDAARTSAGAVVVYRNRSEGELRDIWIARETPDGWATAAVFADNWQVRGCPVNGPAVAASGARVAVAWFTNASNRPRVRVAFSEDSGASFGDPIDVDSARGRRAPIGRVDVVLDGDDALVSWIASNRDRAFGEVRRVSATGKLSESVQAFETEADRASGFPQLIRLGSRVLTVFTRVGDSDLGDVVGLGALTLPVSAVPPAQQHPAPSDEPERGVRTGQAAPSYSARTLDGAPASLADLRGSAVLLNVWATWCEPCRQEMPALSKIHADFQARGLRVVAASVDIERAASRVKDYVSARRLPFTVWLDPGDRASSVFGLGALPASFLIDRQGQIVWHSTELIREDDAQLLRALESATRSQPQ